MCARLQPLRAELVLTGRQGIVQQIEQDHRGDTLTLDTHQPMGGASGVSNRERALSTFKFVPAGFEQTRALMHSEHRAVTPFRIFQSHPVTRSPSIFHLWTGSHPLGASKRSRGQWLVVLTNTAPC